MKIRVILASLLVFSVSAYAQKWENVGDTPQMGWSSWNCFQCEINEAQLREIADLLESKGLVAAGYRYLNIDDGWHGQRDSLGFIHEDPVKFPSGMKSLADYVHSKGLGLGIYSDAGSQTCACYSGSQGREYQDAYTYASWGIDYLKYDWCYSENINPKGAYALMSRALKESGRPIFFSMCEWGSNAPWEWAKDIAHSWRTTGDICVSFDTAVDYGDWKAPSVLDIIDITVDRDLRKYAGPGHWNDPDMLEVGNGMSVNEDRAHFSMWCMMAAPLILGNDLRTMSDETLAIISNRDAIAVNQDLLGVQGLRYKVEGKLEYWFKPLAGGDWAFCLLNRGKEAVDVAVDWMSLCFTDELSSCSTDFDKVKYSVSDVWNNGAKPIGKNTRTGRKALRLSVGGHDVRMFILRKI